MSRKVLIVIGLVGVLAVAAISYMLGRNRSAVPVNPAQLSANAPLQGGQSAPAEERSTDRGEPQPGTGQDPQARQQGQSAGAAAVGEPREVAPDKVRGKIIDTGWRTYVVRSQDTGKKYTFAYGRVTKYNRRQRLGTGDRITVTYQYDRNRLVATRIDIH